MTLPGVVCRAACSVGQVLQRQRRQACCDPQRRRSRCSHRLLTGVQLLVIVATTGFSQPSGLPRPKSTAGAPVSLIKGCSARPLTQIEWERSIRCKESTSGATHGCVQRAAAAAAARLVSSHARPARQDGNCHRRHLRHWRVSEGLVATSGKGNTPHGEPVCPVMRMCTAAAAAALRFTPAATRLPHRVCARELAGMGATVVLAGRSQQKLEATLARIK